MCVVFDRHGDMVAALRPGIVSFWGYDSASHGKMAGILGNTI